MAYRECACAWFPSRCGPLTCPGPLAQREQRMELERLVKKYGKTWEPWKAELKKHKGEGKEWTEGP